jgi:DNA topoisomerase-1
VIESPNKIKKLREITGLATFATVGHFKDLPVDQLGVDLKTYSPTFLVDKDKKGNIDKIKQAAKGNKVFIASDPDREGYAIGTMVYDEIRKIAGECHRLEIHEITAAGIKTAMSKAVLFDKTNKGLYDAFLGRRVGDRIVGYCLSPLANREIPHDRGTSFSVGRVQSPAVRLVVDREREIRNFRPEPYYIVSIELEKGTRFFATYQGGKFKAKADAEAVAARIRAASTALAEKIERKEVSQRPKPPFTTVDLQSAASAQLSLAPERTMQLAQGLFEAGLISYHRTDSVRLAPEFVQEAREFIQKNVGPDYVPATPNEHKSKNSQAEAHEAIRPAHLHPFADCAAIISKEGLTEDHKKLYELIFRRTVASQMAAAVYDAVLYVFDCAGEKFKSTGRTLKFAGFMQIWKDSEEEKSIDKGKDDEDEKDQTLPVVAEGEQVTKTGEKLDEKMTKPPRRYSEASLVKELEKRGIGRPSTYASIVGVIKKREYVRIEKRNLVPSDRGEKLVDFLALKHPWVIDYAMTANMETYLDQVESHENGCSWQAFVKDVHSKTGFIDPGSGSSGSGGSLSEKQMAIITKNAPAAVIKKVLAGDIATGRKFLDDFFKKLEKDKKKPTQKRRA